MLIVGFFLYLKEAHDVFGVKRVVLDTLLLDEVDGVELCHDEVVLQLFIVQDLLLHQPPAHLLIVHHPGDSGALPLQRVNALLSVLFFLLGFGLVVDV